jgi:transposase
MAKPLVDDELWGVIEPLLPAPKPRRFRYPGRKPVDNRRALTGILFVLKTGIGWEDLPQEMGCGSGMTCWRLQGADQLDWSRAVVDSASVRALKGGRTPGRIPRIKPKPGANTM